LVEFGNDSLVRLLPLAHDGCLGRQLHGHLIVRFKQLGGLRGAELCRLPVCDERVGRSSIGAVSEMGQAMPNGVGAISSASTREQRSSESNARIKSHTSYLLADASCHVRLGRHLLREPGQLLLQHRDRFLVQRFVLSFFH